METEIIGLEVTVNKFTGVVARIAKCPSDIPVLAGKNILYREISFTKLYFRNKKAITVDAWMWDMAKLHGAQAMVIYCPDQKMYIIVLGNQLTRAAFMRQKNAPAHYIIPDGTWTEIKHVFGLQIGKPTRIVRQPVEEKPALWNQVSMFPEEEVAA